MESDVRSLNQKLVSAVIVAGLTLLAGTAARADQIEAVKGKQYRLTKKHGPWMVMVASFQEPPEDRKGEGLSPEEAANQLVYELRLKGIPAYTYSQEDVVDEIQTGSARDPEKVRVGKYIAQNGSICVLAGNYESPEKKVAVDTIKYIKNKFKPELFESEEASARGGFLHKLKNGGVYRTTPGRPNPLSGAFLTINPMLSVNEIKSVRSKDDELLLTLNGREDNSLLQNRGKYTVVVASFYGLSKITNDASSKEEDVKIYKYRMDDEVESARELTRSLRNAKALGYDRNYDAYVYHDKYGTVVTIGSFDSPDDPRIEKLQNHFGAKIVAVNEDGSSSLGAEVFSVPRRPAGKVKPKTWLFDPYPKLMEIPRFDQKLARAGN